jgi:4-hydroxyphenylpyruvate dioxygenase-like putative hemolysin
VAILRLQHVGIVVRDLKEACERFETLFGLKARDYRNDQGRGMQLDARILLGNGCWLHLVQNWNPESRVYQFLEKYGPGLEHIAIETDSIEADVARLRGLNVPIYSDKIFNAPDGFEAFVYPDQTLCMTVELIQPHVTSWGYPNDGGVVSSKMDITRMQHLGVAVSDVSAVSDRFEKFFGLVSQSKSNTEAYLPFNNDCWIEFRSSDKPGTRVYEFLEKHGPSIESVALETKSLAADANALKAHGIAAANGNAAGDVWIDGGLVAGTTVELVSAASAT